MSTRYVNDCVGCANGCRCCEDAKIVIEGDELCEYCAEKLLDEMFGKLSLKDKADTQSLCQFRPS